jgi:hypothetical protein
LESGQILRIGTVGKKSVNSSSDNFLVLGGEIVQAAAFPGCNDLFGSIRATGFFESGEILKLGAFVEKSVNTSSDYLLALKRKKVQATAFPCCNDLSGSIRATGFFESGEILKLGAFVEKSATASSDNLLALKRKIVQERTAFPGFDDIVGSISVGCVSIAHSTKRSGDFAVIGWVILHGWNLLEGPVPSRSHASGSVGGSPDSGDIRGRGQRMAIEWTAREYGGGGGEVHGGLVVGWW